LKLMNTLLRAISRVYIVESVRKDGLAHKHNITVLFTTL